MVFPRDGASADHKAIVLRYQGPARPRYVGSNPTVASFKKAISRPQSALSPSSPAGCSCRQSQSRRVKVAIMVSTTLAAASRLKRIPTRGGAWEDEPGFHRPFYSDR